MWPQTDTDPAEAEPRAGTCPRAETFVVLWDDDTAQVRTEREVGQMFDMADTGTMEGMLGVFLPRAGVLMPVRVGGRERFTGGDDEGYGPYYATSSLVIDLGDGSGRTEVVGTVHWTDH